VRSPFSLFTNARAIRVVNARRIGPSDLYHGLLRASWTRLVLGVGGLFLMVNAVFGTLYFLLGGVTNTQSYLDCFFFSVQTFGTIGYGAMFPQSVAAQVVVTLEAFVSLAVNAMATGVVFARFARPTARLVWADIAVVCDRDGLPTLMFRVANERQNHVAEASIRIAILRNETTKEGERLRRVIDLKLVRNSTPAFILTWTVLHQITPDSPLYGLVQQDLVAENMEIIVTLVGHDETLGQTINGRKSYLPDSVLFGSRFVDVISGGIEDRVFDMGKFHSVVPAPCTLPTKAG
jgi:inward rectifier potassium channel